jgi:hypothetical protein
MLLAEWNRARNFFEPVYIVVVNSSDFIGSLKVNGSFEFIRCKVFDTSWCNLCRKFAGIFNFAQA